MGIPKRTFGKTEAEITISGLVEWGDSERMGTTKTPSQGLLSLTSRRPYSYNSLAQKEIWNFNLFFEETEMKVVRTDGVVKEPFVSPLFTGSDVTKQDLLPDSNDFTASVVNFGKGVRNKFHVHDTEQILIVTRGRGIVATEEEEIIVGQGDVILFPAGEKHWHGATEDSEFSHIFITGRGHKTTQLEE